MKFKNVLVIVLAIAVVWIIFYSFRGKDSGNGYPEEINKERQAKDDFMRSSDESPFGDQRKDFEKLNYFPVDESYRISADLVSISDKKVISLSASDGAEVKYLEYGYAQFFLQGKSCKLLILEIMEEGPYRGSLFLAFADETSADETYGAGRYLDVKKIPGATSITLDFNQAYNPYCAYSEKYSCPFPPQGNILKVAVKAGEKKYHP